MSTTEHDAFFCLRTEARLLGVSLVDDIEECLLLVKFARQKHLVIRKHKARIWAIGSCYSREKN